MNPRPVFVIGSPRSGTSILTWSLGQHSNLLALEETNWIARLAIGLGLSYASGSTRGDRTHLSSSDVTRDTFFAEFGKAADRIILDHKPEPGAAVGTAPFRRIRSGDDPKQRWVDGTPLNSYCIYGINLLFPEARFIHLIRDVRQVVPSLMRFSRAGGSDHTPTSAYQHWLDTVNCCVSAEKALGSHRVMRARHSMLVDSPETLLRGCLDFIGEEYSSDCLLPLGKTINSSNVKEQLDIYFGVDEQVVEEATSLADALLDEEAPAYEGDDDAMAELARSYRSRVSHLRAAIAGGPQRLKADNVEEDPDDQHHSTLEPVSVSGPAPQ